MAKARAWIFPATPAPEGRRRRAASMVSSDVSPSRSSGTPCYATKGVPLSTLTAGPGAVHDRGVAKANIIAFLGSPRPHGNTDTLAEAVLEGASAAGCATGSIALRSLRLHHCTGCGNCNRQGRLCIFRDDGDRCTRPRSRPTCCCS